MNPTTGTVHKFDRTVMRGHTLYLRAQCGIELDYRQRHKAAYYVSDRVTCGNCLMQGEAK